LSYREADYSAEDYSSEDYVVESVAPVVEETIGITEEVIAAKTVVSVPPATVPLEQRVGGVLKRLRQKLRLRKGARIVHLGPRYYLPQQKSKQETELVKQKERRKPEQSQIPHYTISVECKAVYSRAAPSPSIQSITNKLVLDDIIRRAQSVIEQEQSYYYPPNITRDNSYQPPMPEITQQPIPEPIIIKVFVVKSESKARYDKLAFVRQEVISRYDKLQTVKVESPIASYSKSILVKNEIIASYTKKKPIAKNWEQQVKTLEGLSVVMAMLDATEQV
jgi:hypothetical protein